MARYQFFSFYYGAGRFWNTLDFRPKSATLIAWYQRGFENLGNKMKIKVQGSKSLLGFATKGGGSWKMWDRFITIDEKDAYHIGNVCGTCAFFFQRLNGANQSLNPREFQNELSSGLTGLTNAQAAVLSELLPDGAFEASLLFRIPRLVTPGHRDDYFCQEQPALWGIDGFWGLPHDPRTKYYRADDKPLDGGAHLFEFLIPMFPDRWLDIKRVSEFEGYMQEGRCPTALAISVLDIKQPANWDGDRRLRLIGAWHTTSSMGTIRCSQLLVRNDLSDCFRCLLLIEAFPAPSTTTS